MDFEKIDNGTQFIIFDRVVSKLETINNDDKQGEMDQLIDLIREETEAAGLDLRDICSIECPDCGFLIMI